MSYEDDLDALHDAVFDEFGEEDEAVFQSVAGGPPVTTKAIVNRGVEIVGEFAETAERRTTIYLPSTDVGRPVSGDTVSIDGELFTIDRPMGDDGHRVEVLTR